jgi:hypothetical protein
LKPGVRYITTLSYGGHGTSSFFSSTFFPLTFSPQTANQFMAIENLLYLGKLLNRVVIMCVPLSSPSYILSSLFSSSSPTLTALHFEETPRDFSHFYDLDRFYHESRIPAIELSSMKWWNFSTPPPLEPLSCWSILELTAGGRNVNDGALHSPSCSLRLTDRLRSCRLDGGTVRLSCSASLLSSRC